MNLIVNNIPSKALHQRYYENNMTRYQYDDIAAVMTEANEANARYVELFGEVWALVEPRLSTRNSFIQTDEDRKLEAEFSKLFRLEQVRVLGARGQAEAWPLAKSRTEIARLKRAIKRIEVFRDRLTNSG